VGSGVGAGVGSGVGAGVGSGVGAGVGSGVGAGVGSGVGAGVGGGGGAVGTGVGGSVGAAVGAGVGGSVGAGVGGSVGAAVGGGGNGVGSVVGATSGVGVGVGNGGAIAPPGGVGCEAGMTASAGEGGVGMPFGVVPDCNHNGEGCGSFGPVSVAEPVESTVVTAGSGAAGSGLEGRPLGAKIPGVMPATGGATTACPGPGPDEVGAAMTNGARAMTTITPMTIPTPVCVSFDGTAMAPVSCHQCRPPVEEGSRPRRGPRYDAEDRSSPRVVTLDNPIAAPC
jgi:hypothetical protein